MKSAHLCMHPLPLVPRLCLGMHTGRLRLPCLGPAAFANKDDFGMKMDPAPDPLNSVTDRTSKRATHAARLYGREPAEVRAFSWFVVLSVHGSSNENGNPVVLCFDIGGIRSISRLTLAVTGMDRQDAGPTVGFR